MSFSTTQYVLKIQRKFYAQPENYVKYFCYINRGLNTLIAYQDIVILRNLDGNKYQNSDTGSSPCQFWTIYRN